MRTRAGHPHWTGEQTENALRYGVCRVCREPYERVLLHDGERVERPPMSIETAQAIGGEWSVKLVCGCDGSRP